MNKYYHNILSIIIIAGILLLLLGNNGAYAGETLSGNSVSENKVSENGISENGVSDNAVSDNDAPSDSGNVTDKVTVSITGISAMRDAAIVSISADCNGGGIALIQTENVLAGVRKTLYRAGNMEKDTREDSKCLDFRVTANGSYMFYAYDTKGNYDSCRAEIHELVRQTMDEYQERAAENQKKSTKQISAGEGMGDRYPERGYRTVKLGGETKAAGYITEGFTGSEYKVRSGEGGDASGEPEVPEKYGDWGMLKTKNRKKDIKAWYEPYTDTGEPVSKPQSLENVIDLSDYEAELFRPDITGVPGSSGYVPEGQGESAESKEPELIFTIPDANIDHGNREGQAIDIWIMVFIAVLLILFAALVLFRGRVRRAKAVRASGKKRAGNRGKNDKETY